MFKTSKIYGKEQFSVDEWIDIILERFSKSEILRFIKYNTNSYPCPWDCIECEYNILTIAELELHKFGCRERYIWRYVNKSKNRKIKNRKTKTQTTNYSRIQNRTVNLKKKFLFESVFHFESTK